MRTFRFRMEIVWHGTFFAIVHEIERTVDQYPDVDALAFDTWGVDFGLFDEKGEKNRHGAESTP